MRPYYLGRANQIAQVKLDEAMQERHWRAQRKLKPKFDWSTLFFWVVVLFWVSLFWAGSLYIYWTVIR